jgi:hypothetical protein
LYSQFQRFVATLLLFSILLQSCGNPNCQMIAPVHPSTHGQTNNAKSLVSLAPINQQEDRAIATAYNNAPTVCAAEALAEVANQAAYVHPLRHLVQHKIMVACAPPLPLLAM